MEANNKKGDIIAASFKSLKGKKKSFVTDSKLHSAVSIETTPLLMRSAGAIPTFLDADAGYACWPGRVRSGFV